MRDFDDKPYSPDEERVAAYLRRLLPEVGTGDDPIGFLIASHATIVEERRAASRGPEGRLEGVPDLGTSD